MSAPIRKGPETLARNDRILIVGDANEFGVRRAALHANPVQISRNVSARNCVVDLVSPKQAFTCAVI
jgi:hypothetical protein